MGSLDIINGPNVGKISKPNKSDKMTEENDEIRYKVKENWVNLYLE